MPAIYKTGHDVNKFPISYYSSQYMILSHLAENTEMFSFVPQNPIPKKKIWRYGAIFGTDNLMGLI